MAATKLGSLTKTTSPVLLRVGFFAASAAFGFIYVMSVATGEVVDVAPYFLVAILLQFLPFLVRTTPDPFEPSSFNSIMTLIALVPALMTYLVNDTVTLNLLPNVSGRARIELVQTVMVAYIVGTVSYYAGYYLGLGRRMTGFFPDVAGGTWQKKRLVHVYVIVAALFLPAYAWFQSKVGVSLTDVTQLSAGKAVWREEGTATWLIRAVTLGFIPPLFLVATILPKPRWGRAIATTALVVAIALLTVRLGQRGPVVYCIVSVLVVVHYLGRRIPLWLLVAIGFGLLVASNLFGAYRTTRSDQVTATQGGPTANFNPTQALTEHEEDRERIAAVAVVFHFFPERKDYLLGESWGPVLTMLIPRWVWAGKSSFFRYTETGIVLDLVGAPVPVNYLGLLFANFSWFGIVLGMFGWGAFQRGLYEWLLKNEKDRSVVVLYSAYVLHFGPTLLQLSAALGFLLPIYVAIRYMRAAPKSHRLSPKRVAGALPSSPPPAEPAPAPTAAE